MQCFRTHLLSFLQFEIFPFPSIFTFYLSFILSCLLTIFRTTRNFSLNVLGVRVYYFNFVWPLTAKQTASVAPSRHTPQT